MVNADACPFVMNTGAFDVDGQQVCAITPEVKLLTVTGVWSVTIA